MGAGTVMSDSSEFAGEIVGATVAEASDTGRASPAPLLGWATRARAGMWICSSCRQISCSESTRSKIKRPRGADTRQRAAMRSVRRPRRSPRVSLARNNPQRLPYFGRAAFRFAPNIVDSDSPIRGTNTRRDTVETRRQGGRGGSGRRTP